MTSSCLESFRKDTIDIHALRARLKDGWAPQGSVIELHATNRYIVPFFLYKGFTKLASVHINKIL
jgi:hypothetical protein